MWRFLNASNPTALVAAAQNDVEPRSNGANPYWLAAFDFSTGTGLNNWHVEAFIENVFDKRGQLGKNSECNDSAFHYCLLNAHIYPIKPMEFGVKFGQKF